MGRLTDSTHSPSSDVTKAPCSARISVLMNNDWAMRLEEVNRCCGSWRHSKLAHNHRFSAGLHPEHQTVHSISSTGRLFRIETAVKDRRPIRKTDEEADDPRMAYQDARFRKSPTLPHFVCATLGGVS